MPRFVFDGPIAYQYPAIRDTSGIHLNEVEPGEVRDLDAAPDRWWVLVSDEAEPEPAADIPAPDGPQPAPPAIVPDTQEG